MAQKNATAVEAPAAEVSAVVLLPYQKIHELTNQVVDKYKYLTGHPKQFRFDAKDGQFNINGQEKLGRTLTFQPIAWRIFADNILNMGTKNWAELFFIDEKNCVSAILFHGYSVDNIFRLIEPLFYDDLTLADVVITAVAEKKENNKIQPKGVYYISTFSYKMADPDKTAELKLYAQDRKLFREETLTDIANVKTAMNYYNPFAHGGAAELGVVAPEGVNSDTGEVTEESQTEQA
ncbi:hypothetical protein [Spirosoma oryzicola]|uniref:hypothetical protein n=1 Tax=Spirosoma oryzicola TaxID=2898794 RepID=UPI001E41DBE6|nr:hypothetical protein [Spirosoma oryzicola]UHG94705.1 hypothetical protein LQ777_29345 [Spirosoma oryzicola]